MTINVLKVLSAHNAEWADAGDDVPDYLQALRQTANALHEIADSKYCNYERTQPRDRETGAVQYGIGVTDGHRFCATIAKKALGKI